MQQKADTVDENDLPLPLKQMLRENLFLQKMTFLPPSHRRALSLPPPPLLNMSAVEAKV